MAESGAESSHQPSSTETYRGEAVCCNFTWVFIFTIFAGLWAQHGEGNSCGQNLEMFIIFSAISYVVGSSKWIWHGVCSLHDSSLPQSCVIIGLELILFGSLSILGAVIWVSAAQYMIPSESCIAAPDQFECYPCYAREINSNKTMQGFITTFFLFAAIPFIVSLSMVPFACVRCFSRRPLHTSCDIRCHCHPE